MRIKNFGFPGLSFSFCDSFHWLQAERWFAKPRGQQFHFLRQKTVSWLS